MKRITLRLISLATLLVLILPAGGLTAATGPVNPFSDPDGAQRVYLPVLGKNTSFLPTIIPETTNVLTSESTNQLASISEDGTTYTFAAISSELQRVDVGDVIISGVSDAAPYGFLRKVTSRQTQGSGLKLVTEQATIEDAYQQVSVSLQQTLTPEGLQGFSALPGVTLVQSPNGVNAGDFKFQLNNTVLFDKDNDLSTTDDQVVANGSLVFSPNLVFRLTVANFTLQELYFSETLRVQTGLTVSSKLSLTISPPRNPVDAATCLSPTDSHSRSTTRCGACFASLCGYQW